jgi:hypothetical protein
MSSDNSLLIGIGVGILAYGVYKSQAGADNKYSLAQRPTQILYSDAARIPPGSLLSGARVVHPNRVDFLGRNGVIYVGYFAGDQIPSSTIAKRGFP